MKKRYIDMLQGPLFPSIIRYTIPIILTSVLQLLFNAADLVIVGQYCGSISVAAVGATGSIINLIVNLFIGLSVGAGVTVAHAWGSHDDVEVHRTVHTSMLVALVGGVILTIVGVCFSETFLRWMKTPENVLELSAVYMRIYFCGILFSLVYNFCASILRAAGDTKGPLMYLSIAGVVNVGLNVIFVRYFHMNVAGVALATTISQGISAALTVLALKCRLDACRLNFRKIRFYKEQFLKLVRIGLPAGIQGALFSIANVMIQSSINGFGDVVVSGNAAAGNIEGFVYVIMNGFHQTALNFAGQNTGAKQYRRVLKVLWICLGCVAVAGLISGVSAYGAGQVLLSFYITDSPEAISVGMTRLMYLALPYFVCGLMDVSTGVLRGVGASISPMIISVLGICGLRIAWIHTIFKIPAYHTPEVLYLTYLVSWIVTFAAEMTAFVVVYRRKVKQTPAAINGAGKIPDA